MPNRSLRAAVLALSLATLAAGLVPGLGMLPATASASPAEATATAVQQSIATSVVGGNSHSCALTDAGGVKCWGDDGFGESGDGQPGGSTRRPTDVTGLTSGVTQIVAGGRFTCALLDSGTVQCWGDNGSDVMGANTHSTVEPLPLTMTGLPNDVVSLVAGQAHVCALDADGAVLCWGSNTFGQIGIGTGSFHSQTPVTPGNLDSGVVGLTAGHWHTCALLTDDSVKCWGHNGRDQLGTDTNGDEQWEPTTVADLPDGVTTLTAGLYHTCALTTSGAVWCWGDNSAAQLGDDQAEVQSATPIQVPGVSGATGLSAGAIHTCVVVGDGVKCWGTNYSGVLGDGTVTLRAHPVDVVGLSDPIAQVESAWTHTCVVTEGGGVRCWGDNRRFALGVRHPKQAFLTPVTVRGFRGTDNVPT